MTTEKAKYGEKSNKLNKTIQIKKGCARDVPRLPPGTTFAQPRTTLVQLRPTSYNSRTTAYIFRTKKVARAFRCAKVVPPGDLGKKISEPYRKSRNVLANFVFPAAKTLKIRARRQAAGILQKRQAISFECLLAEFRDVLLLFCPCFFAFSSP